MMTIWSTNTRMNENIRNTDRILEYKLFKAYSNIFGFTTTRMGGCGIEKYSSFNCSPYCGDKEEHVLQNQKILHKALPQEPKQLIIPRQVHGTEIQLIDEAFLSLSQNQQQEELNGVDALITAEPGCCICVSTADCVPILIYDHKNQVVAVVHSGWRGTVDSITTKTLEMMKERFGTSGEDVSAVIGPSISLESFEVGEEVYLTFKEKGFDMSRISLWKEETQKYHIDLWEAVGEQLHAFGVLEKNIECARICTFVRHEEFFSARRLGIKSGRMLSGIVIK